MTRVTKLKTFKARGAFYSLVLNLDDDATRVYDEEQQVQLIFLSNGYVQKPDKDRHVGKIFLRGDDEWMFRLDYTDPNAPVIFQTKGPDSLYDLEVMVARFFINEEGLGDLVEPELIPATEIIKKLITVKCLIGLYMPYMGEDLLGEMNEECGNFLSAASIEVNVSDDFIIDAEAFYDDAILFFVPIREQSIQNIKLLQEQLKDMLESSGHLLPSDLTDVKFSNPDTCIDFMKEQAYLDRKLSEMYAYFALMNVLIKASFPENGESVFTGQTH